MPFYRFEDFESNYLTPHLSTGDIIYVPRPQRYRLSVTTPYARYALVCSTPYLEDRIDNMTPEQCVAHRHQRSL